MSKEKPKEKPESEPPDVEEPQQPDETTLTQTIFIDSHEPALNKDSSEILNENKKE